MKFIKLEHFIEFAISVFFVIMFYRIDTHSSISVSSTCYPVSYLLRGWSILSTSGRLWHHPLVGCTPVKQKSLCADDIKFSKKYIHHDKLLILKIQQPCYHTGFYYMYKVSMKALLLC